MKKLLGGIIAASAIVLACWASDNDPDVSLTTIRVGKSPMSIMAADLDGDHIQDIMVANGGDSSVTILMGKGKGVFRESPGSPFYAGSVPNDIAVTDLNKDGMLDLVFANHTKKYL